MIPVSFVVSIVWVKKVAGFFRLFLTPVITPYGGSSYGNLGWANLVGIVRAIFLAVKIGGRKIRICLSDNLQRIVGDGV